MGRRAYRVAGIQPALAQAEAQQRAVLAAGQHAFQGLDVHQRTSCSSSCGPGWKRPRWNSRGAPPFSWTSMMRPASSR
ncbi:hypothetical protein G6F35_016675 [Rhizopus arrhizus]|nr:hypothetical protein G6F24_017516 [Rhizopus arrhizus]KAG1076632.1 hypothetical protein G6F40_017306 [Rhizopus arrhizus]KAG1174265.1 hypothetical protein G6F35_016675 [Rhizopus arrhizus]